MCRLESLFEGRLCCIADLQSANVSCRLIKNSIAQILSSTDWLTLYLVYYAYTSFNCVMRRPKCHCTTLQSQSGSGWGRLQRSPLSACLQPTKKIALSIKTPS